MFRKLLGKTPSKLLRYSTHNNPHTPNSYSHRITFTNFWKNKRNQGWTSPGLCKKCRLSDAQISSQDTASVGSVFSVDISTVPPVSIDFFLVPDAAEAQYLQSSLPAPKAYERPRTKCVRCLDRIDMPKPSKTEYHCIATMENIGATWDNKNKHKAQTIQVARIMHTNKAQVIPSINKKYSKDY